MDATTLTEILAATAAWTGICGGAIWKFYSDIKNTIREQADISRQEHKELRAQVTDMATTFRDNYVRRDDFARELTQWNETMHEARREVGEVRNLLIGMIGRDVPPRG